MEVQHNGVSSATNSPAADGEAEPEPEGDELDDAEGGGVDSQDEDDHPQQASSADASYSNNNGGGRGYHLGPSADWSPEAISDAHIFVPTSSQEDSAYVDKGASGNRMKCVSCRIVCPEDAIGRLNEKLTCRPTFRENVRKYREQTSVEHHWVQRRSLKGKCKHCGKAFPSKLGFGSSKEVVGVSCSWCKYSYHSKDLCLAAMKENEKCDLGAHANAIIPPSWIVKLQRKGSFKSSLKSSPNKSRQRRQQRQHSTSKENPKSPDNSLSRPFCLKPIPSTISPILVFLNPKSGGNQGAKLMQKFQWLLNPRQVFDLTQGGPRPAIELFQKVPNVKLLACGGDGTVGWLLSVLDKVEIHPPPAVSVLPLGTGNDLSRSLGWGGGYIDEPISKILTGLQHADEVSMDRWQLKVTRNSEYPSTEKGHDELPLNVVNNYFSLGVDAHIALQFHEAREANPQKYNSRIKNKMFYGTAGGKNLLVPRWKDLSDDITVECDGKDITPKLKEAKVHSVLFANIPNFGSGTKPWNPSAGEQRIDDGLIEVIGLSIYTLPMLQAGSHGTCFCQCKSAKIRTKKTIPMQVDGEASRLNPADIELTFLNQVRMLAKRRSSSSHSRATYSSTTGEGETEAVILKVWRLSMRHYEKHHYDKEKLKEFAKRVGEIETTSSADLEQARALIAKLLQADVNKEDEQPDWCFIDTVTAIRFFRIDRAQEHLHYVMDIADTSGIYILGEDVESTVSSPTEAEADGQKASQSDEEGGVTAASADAITPTSPNQMIAEIVDEVAEPAEAKAEPEVEAEAEDVFVAVEGGGCGAKKEQNNNSSSVPVKETSPKASQTEKELLELAKSKSVGKFPQRTLVAEQFFSGASPTITQVLEKTTEGVLKAARLGDLPMLTELHQAGYSLLSIDETGKTALHYGARFGSKEIVRYLIMHAPVALIDLVDNEKGQTALHKAAGYKRRTICCMLVAAGASLLIKDHADLTPRQLALLAEDVELASYLESQEEFQREKAERGGHVVNHGDFETPV